MFITAIKLGNYILFTWKFNSGCMVAYQTEGNIAIQFSDTDFLLMISRSINSIWDRLQVISNFRLVINGGKSISAVSWIAELS